MPIVRTWFLVNTCNGVFICFSGQYGRVYFGHLKDEKTGKIFEVAIKTIKGHLIKKSNFMNP